MTELLAPSVRELLETRIDSFEKLGLVLALWHAVDKTMTIDELQRALPQSRDTLRVVIAELTGAKLAEHTSRGAVRLAPSEADRDALAELATLWDCDCALVARVLSELAVARIRGMAEKALTRGR